MNPQPLHDLKSEDYEHPLDEQAMRKLKETKGLNKVVRKFYELGFEITI